MGGKIPILISIIMNKIPSASFFPVLILEYSYGLTVFLLTALFWVKCLTGLTHVFSYIYPINVYMKASMSMKSFQIRPPKRAFHLKAVYVIYAYIYFFYWMPVVAL